MPASPLRPIPSCRGPAQELNKQEIFLFRCQPELISDGDPSVHLRPLRPSGSDLREVVRRLLQSPQPRPHQLISSVGSYRWPSANSIGGHSQRFLIHTFWKAISVAEPKFLCLAHLQLFFSDFPCTGRIQSGEKKGGCKCYFLDGLQMRSHYVHCSPIGGRYTRIVVASTNPVHRATYASK